MAIDPSIPLQIQQQPSLLNQIGQVNALKNAKQEQQLRQYALNQAGQQQQDQQSVRDAFSQNTQQNPDGSVSLNRAGAIGQLYKTAPQQALQYSQQFTKQDIENQKAVADYTKTNLENAKNHVDFIDRILQGVSDQPTYDKAHQAAVAAGVVKPGEMPDVYDPTLVSQLHARSLQQKDAISQQLEAAKAKETQRHNAQTETTAANTQDETAAYHGIEAKQRGQQLGIEGARLNLERQKQGIDNDQAIETQAQQIANGDVKGLSQARQNPFARAVMARVYEINPKYSDSLYTATQDLRSSKPNSMGGNVGRLGTAVLHADNALNESNKLGFSTGLLSGISTPGTAGYHQAAEFLTGEIGQYVTGGKLTVDEGNKLSSDLMASRQSVRDAALHKIIDLSGGKLKSQMEQFKNATQTEFPTDRVFNDPDIKGSLQKHGLIGGQSSGLSVTAPDGSVHTFPDAQSAANFKKLAGIQ